MNLKRNTIILLLLQCGVPCYSQIEGSLMHLSQLALAKNPVLKKNLISVKSAEADLQQQKSIFDYNLYSGILYENNSYRLFDTDLRNQYLNKFLKTNNLDINAGIQKKLRTSQIIAFDIKYSYNDNNIPFNSYSQPINPYIGDYTNTFNFSITQPLIKGKGKNIATIPERTSEIIVQIIKDQNIYAASNEILQIAVAYWEYYNAYRGLTIYKDNEARVKNVLDMTSDLVKADKKPSGDLLQIKADLANQEKLTIQAAQNLFIKKINLGLAIGLSEEDTRQIDIPIDNYPSILESGYTEMISSEDFVNMAIENRADISALQKNTQALELQLELSKNNLKPTLDLTGFAYYGNASQGNAKSYKVNTLYSSEGRYIGAGAKLTFNFALNNNLAKGIYNKDLAAIEDQEVMNLNLRRSVELTINKTMNDLSSNVEALKRSKEALDNYKLAFENEQAKFQTGLTTLLNVILFQERLTSAELEYLRAQQQYAIAIVNLRHETGTLISSNSQNLSINDSFFYKIPNTSNH